MGRSSQRLGAGGWGLVTKRRRAPTKRAHFSLRARLESLERRDLLTSYAYTTAEDTALTVTDATISGATIVTAPTHGKVSFAASGGFVYTPAENYNGSDSFTFSINPNTTSPPTTVNDVSITITPVNDPPKVFPDQFAAQENTTLSVDALGVLKNDTDVDGDHLTAILVSTPAHGSVHLGDGGGFTYTPATDYFGPDSFTYKASDGQTTSDATTAYLYVAQNKPVAHDDYYGVLQNGTLNIPAPGVLANDVGINGRSLSASLEDGHGPQHGNVTVNGDGSFTYTPATGYFGDDSFVYRATDNSPAANPLPAAYSDATVHVSVRSTAPIIYAANDSYTAVENLTLSIAPSGVLTNDKVYSGDATSNTTNATPLNIPLNSIVVGGPSHGTLTLNADGSFSYAPAPNYVGGDTFTYRAVLAPPAGTTTSPASNPISHDVATVTIKIVTPIVATNDIYSTQQNVTLSIAKPGVLSNDYFAIPLPPLSQPNVLPTNQPLFTASLTSGPADGAGSVTLNADGSFTFVPATDFVGVASFTYQDSFTLLNEDGTTAATLLSNVATVAINVKVPTPTAHDDHFLVLQNTTLNMAVPGVLGNDVKADDYPLVANLQQGPAHGSLTLNADGSFSYQPIGGYAGDDSFTYYDTETYVPPQTPGGPVSDPIVIKSATATVTISVRAPVIYANNDTFVMVPGSTLSIDPPGVLKNDYLVDPTNTAAGTSPINLPLAATIVSTTSNGTLTLNTDGSFTYVPSAGFTGADSFTYRASVPPNPPPTGGTTSTDTNGNITTHDVATVTIWVEPIAPSPVAVDDSFSIPEGSSLKVTAPGIIGNDKKADGSSLQAVLGTRPSHGGIEFHADGSFTYTPTGGFTGDDSFTYQDLELLANPAPPSGDPNQYISNFATVTIHVTPINSAPLAVNDYFKVLQGGSIIVDPPGVLANDKGPDGDTLVAVLDSTTAHGDLIFSAAGGFTYTPYSNSTVNFTGFDTFTYHLVDTSSTDTPQPTSNIATVTIYVAPLHPQVYANPDYFQMVANAPLTVTAPGVLRNDTLYPPTLAGSGGMTNTTSIQQSIPSIGDYTLTAALLTSVDPSAGTLDFHSDGSFTFTAASTFSGKATFTYQATATANSAGNDGTTASTSATSNAVTNIATVTIYVSQPEPPPGPVANNDYFVTAENTELDIRAPGVLANDYFKTSPPPPQPGSTTITQPPSPHFTVILVSGPAQGTGTLTPNADGSFAFIPATDFVGAATFTYQDSVTLTAADGTTTTLLSNIATVTIKIVPAIAHPDAYQVQQGATLTVAAPGVLANDQGGSTTSPLAATTLMQPMHGTLTLNSDGSFQYVPATGYSGPDLFTYRATAGVNSTLSTASDGSVQPTPNAIDVGIVKIYVMPTVSREIEAHDDKYIVAQGNELDVDGPGVLANDNGPVNVPVIATLVTDVQHGTLALDAGGGFIYTPADGFTGEDHFTYTASAATAGSTVKPGTATVTIYVVSTTATPEVIVGADQQTSDESGAQHVADFAAVPVDDAGQPPPVTVTTDHPEMFKVQPAIDSTGQLTFTPAPNVCGDATVTVTTHNPSGDTTQTFTIHIDKPHLLHNASISGDVNNDGIVAPNDLVKIISYLNGYGASSVQTALSASGEGESGGGNSYYDVSGDDQIAPNDLLMIISQLNAGDGGPAGESSPAMDSGLLALVAQDTAEATMGRKKV